MSTFGLVVGIVLTLGPRPTDTHAQAAQAKPAQQAAAPAQAAMAPDALDKLLAPVALYPDQLLTQMLLCTSNPPKIQELSGWLVKNAELTGTALQNAAEKAGFEPSFVVLALFPQVVNYMADNIAWTRSLGKAFATDRKGVLDSVQRLRAEAKALGTLKSTPQQTVETKTTTRRRSGHCHRAGQPAGGLRPAVQPASRLHAACHEHGGDQGRGQQRRGRRGGRHRRICRRHRHRRGDGQRLLLRALRMARRRLHVQRRVGRLLRRPRGRAGGFLRSPRGRARRLAGPQRGPRRPAQRTRQQRPGAARRARRHHTVRAGADRAAAGPAGERGPRHRRRRSGPGSTPSTSSVESRGRSSGRPARLAADRSGTRSDAFSGYSSGSRERSASSRGSGSRGGRSGGGGRRR